MLPDCPNCGTAASGEYCSRCGQKRITRHHLSFGAFAREAFKEVGDLEHSKIFRTVCALLFRPGLLTSDYLSGRRAHWITPLKLYLALFALALFLYSLPWSVGMFDVTKVSPTRFASFDLRQGITDLAARQHVSESVVAGEINSRWRSYVSCAQILYPFLFALLLKPFYLRQRRFFTEHLIFGLHFQSFVILLTALAWPVYLLTGMQPARQSVWLSIFVIGVITTYLTVALHRVYGPSWPVSASKGVVLYVGHFVIYSLITFSLLGVAFCVAGRGL